MTTSVALLGASGFAGGEIVRLVDDHPHFELVYLGAHSKAGKSLRAVHPHLGGGERILRTISAKEIPDVALVFLALPHGASAHIGEALRERNIRVVDLGSDFRLDTAERYLRAYRAEHPFPGRLSNWVYGIPEFAREQIVGADAVAAPGCYPTSALLALIPLLRAGVISDDGIVVNSLSGVSGAGRALKEELLFGTIEGGVRAYGVAEHRHRPEIEMGLSQALGREVGIVFTPHLVPMQRGMLSTISARIAKDARVRGGPSQKTLTNDDLREILSNAYVDEPFVDVIDISPQTRWVVGSNRALITAFVDHSAGAVIVISAIDNLIKGAAGQALQCANLMCGFSESAGLTRAGWMP